MAFAKLLSAKIKKKKAAFKFKLTTFYERIDCEFQKGYEPNKLVIRWSRGTREVLSSSPTWTPETDDDSAVQGKAVFVPVQAVELLVTLYKPPKTVDYDDKFYKYTIEDVGVNGKKHHLGVFELNVAEYANVLHDKYELALICKSLTKKVFNISIVMRLEVEFLKSGSAQDDDMISTWSALPGNDTHNSDEEYTDDDSFRSRGLSTDLASMLGESLVSLITRNKQELIIPDGMTGDLNSISDSKSLALLFSANWSDTCVSFLQTVDKFYHNPSIKEGRAFDVIYVSCDYDDDNLLQGIKKHSISYACIKPKSLLAENLKEHYEVACIPQLLIVNPVTGRVIEGKGKTELDKCQGSVEEQKTLAAIWSKGKNSLSPQKLIAIKEASFGSSISLSSTLDGISENAIGSNRRKGSVKQLNSEQLIAQLELKLRQKDQELRVNKEQLQTAQEEIVNLLSENESLQSKNFEISDQVRQLKIIVKEFGDQNRAMADEKQQLVAAMEVKGWLFKRGISGPTGRKWRKRYFQANGFFLSYYKSLSTSVEQGSINLKKVSDITILPDDKQDKNLASFNIITEDRVYELLAKNSEEMNTWIRAVNYLTSYYKDNMLQSYRKNLPHPPSLVLDSPANSLPV